MEYRHTPFRLKKWEPSVEKGAIAALVSPRGLIVFLPLYTKFVSTPCSSSVLGSKDNTYAHVERFFLGPS